MRGVDQIRRSSTGEAHERYLSGSLRDSSHKDPNHSVHTSINAATNNAVGSYPNDNNNGHKNANSTLNKKFAGHHNSLKSTTNSAVLANMAGPEARRMQRRLSASAGPGVDPLEVLNWKNACNNRINNNINNINLKAIGKNAVDDSNNNDDDDKQQQQRRNLFLSSSLGVGGYPTKTTPKIITKAPSLSTSNGGLPRDLVGCTILIPLKRRTTRSVDGLASVGVSENFNLHNSRGYHSDPDVDVDDLSYFCYDDDSEDTSVSEITFDEKAFQNPHLLDRRAVFQHSRRASASDVIAGGGGGIGMASMGGGMGMDSSSRNLNLSSQQQQNLKYVNLRTSRGPYDESSESEVDDDDDDDDAGGCGEGDDTEFGESKNRSETVFPGSVIVKKPRNNRPSFCGGRGPSGFALFGGRGPGGRGLGRAISDRNMMYGKQKSSRFLGALTGKRNSVKEEEENVDSECDDENKDKKEIGDGKNKKDPQAPPMAAATPAKNNRLAPPEDDDYEKPVTLRPFSRSSKGSVSVASHSIAEASECPKSRASSTSADSKTNDAIAAVSTAIDVDVPFMDVDNANATADNNNDDNANNDHIKQDNNNAIENPDKKDKPPSRRPINPRKEQNHPYNNHNKSLLLLDSIIELKLELAQKQSLIDELSSNYNKLILRNDFLQNNNASMEYTKKENEALKKENKELKDKLLLMEKLLASVSNNGLFPEDDVLGTDGKSISESARGSVAGEENTSQADRLSVLSRSVDVPLNDMQHLGDGVGGGDDPSAAEDENGEKNPFNSSHSTISTTSVTKSCVSRTSKTSNNSRTSRHSSPDILHHHPQQSQSQSQSQHQSQYKQKQTKSRRFSGSIRALSSFSGLLGLADEECVPHSSHGNANVNKNTGNEDGGTAVDTATVTSTHFYRQNSSTSNANISIASRATTSNNNDNAISIADAKSGLFGAGSLADSIMSNFVGPKKRRSSGNALSVNSELLSDWGDVDTDDTDDEDDDDLMMKRYHSDYNATKNSSAMSSGPNCLLQEVLNNKSEEARRPRRCRSGGALGLGLELDEECKGGDGNGGGHPLKQQQPKSFNQWFALIGGKD